jgi:hypothetical protein
MVSVALAGLEFIVLALLGFVMFLFLRTQGMENF